MNALPSGVHAKYALVLTIALLALMGSARAFAGCSRLDIRPVTYKCWNPAVTLSTDRSTYLGSPNTATVQITASASRLGVDDSGALITHIDLFYGTTKIATINNPSSTSTFTTTYSWTGVGAGAYALYAVGYDNGGQGVNFRGPQRGNSSTDSITVNADVPPSVGITSPASGTVFNVASGITLTASASSSDTSVSGVTYVANGSSIGSGSGSNYSLAWSGMSAGAYSIAATATDAVGGQTTSSAISVTAYGPVIGHVDGISAGGDGQKYLGGWVCDKFLPQSIQIQLYRNGPSGAGVYVGSYSANAATEATVNSTCLDSGVAHRFSLPLGNLSATFPNQPLYVYGISATGGPNVLLPNSGSFSIPADDPPSVSLSAGSSYTAPTNVALTASASDLWGGTVNKVEFYAGSSTTPFATVTTPPYTASYPVATGGTYTFTAKAYDNLGVTTTSTAVSVPVGTGNGATFVSQTVPATMLVGQSYLVTIVMRNTGTQAWTTASNYRLGSQNPQSNTTWGMGRVALPSGSVAVGATVAFTFNVTPPSTAGTYNFQWQMVQDNVEWFGAMTPNVVVNVTPASAGGIAVPNLSALTAGTLPGTPTVDKSGAATYAIELAVPPGTADIVPKLSLNYSSLAPDGLLGRGWSLGGLSSITRCPRTLAQDNYAGKVGLDSNDRFCLNGQRIVLVAGAAYGADQAEYRTEVDTFVKVISNGTAGQGPSWFKVWTKSGSIIEYGHTADSQVLAQDNSTVLVWSANKVQDHSGNYLTIGYTDNTATGEQYPAQISYTGNAGSSPALAPYNAVRFVYETRPDGILKHVGGSPLATTKRIKNVQAFTNIDSSGNGGTLVRDYRISYLQSSQSNRSLIDHITLCDGAGNCLPATQLTWQQRQTSDNIFTTSVWGGPAVTFTTSTTPTLELPQKTIVGDFNGDGLTDLGYSNGTGTWSICLSAGSSFQCQNWTGGPALKADQVLFGDFNGDGLTDIAVPPATSGAPWQVYLSTGSGFAAMQNWAGLSQTSSVSNYIVGDFNGDGRSDIGIAFAPSVGSTLCTSTGSATSGFSCVAYDGIQVIVGDFDAAGRIYPNLGDLNADGRQDVVGWTGLHGGPPRYTWESSIASDNHITSVGGASAPSGLTGTYGPTTGGALLADWAGDGNDAMVPVFFDVTSTTPTNEFCKSTGTTVQCTALPSGVAPYFGSRHFGDTDGDSRPDLLMPLVANLSNPVVCQVGVDQNLQPSITCANWILVGSAYPSTAILGFIGDFNGDGKSDYTFYDTNTQQWSVSLAGGPTPDLLSSIQDGNGSQTQFTYKPLTDNTVYAKDSGANAATYPQRDVQDPTHVVSEMRSDNGVGGFLVTDYKYGGKKRDLTGRGDLDFRWVEATDSVSHVTTHTEFAQSFPFIGATALVKSTHSSGVVLKNIQYTLAQTTGSASGVPFAYISQSTEADTDLDGTAIQTVTTTPTYGSVGSLNYGNIVQNYQIVTAVGDSFTSNTVNTLPTTVDTTNWLLPMVQQSQITKTAPGAGTVTRTTAFDYYPGTSLTYHVTVEPGSTAYQAATTYTRDAFGNATQTSIAWTDPVSGTAKTRTIERQTLDSRGRWATTLTNALNQSEQRTYDDAYGNPTSTTDPNGITNYIDYDTFGRKTQERHADGTYVTTAYKQCASNCGSYGKTAVIVENWASGTVGAWSGGQQIAVPLETYSDTLGRAVLTQTWGLDGTEIDAETRYDALDHVSQQARPHFTSDSPVWTLYDGYDDLGRVTHVTDPDGPTSTTYSGLVFTTVNQKSQSRTETRNGLGKVKSVKDASANVTQYLYDPFGNLIATTDPLGNQATVTLDRLGRRTGMHDPDLGTWQYSVNPLGQIYGQIDANNNSTSFIYDDLGRLTQRQETDLLSTWIYDTAPKGIGLLAEAYTGAAGNKSYRRVYAYDSLARPTATTTTLDEDYVTSQSYDSFGRVSGLTHQHHATGGSGGPTQSFTYIFNPFGKLSAISQGATTYWQANSADALLRVTQEVLGNGLVTGQIFFPTTSRLQAIQTGPGGGSSVQNTSYTYDAVGNLSSRTDVIASSGTTVSESYGYDPLNRLTLSSGTTNGSGLPTKSITPDALGDITYKSDVGTYNYPASGTGSVRPHTPTSITGTVNGTTNPNFTYDNNGNMLSGPGRATTWMSFNMPSVITQTSVTPNAVDSFVYGPEHQRAKQTQQSGGTIMKTLYYADAMEKEVAAAGTTLKTYLPAGLGVLLDNGTSIQVRYFLKDRLGSVDVVAKEDGTVAERMSYDAWGRRRNIDGTDDTTNAISGMTDNRGYTGEEMLDNARLVHLNGRVYDPLLGRFISADPYIADPADLQSLNRYAYVHNNPLAFVDSSGYIPDEPVQEQSQVAIAARDIRWEMATLGEPVQCFGNCIGSGGLVLKPEYEEQRWFEGGVAISSAIVPIYGVYSRGTFLGNFNPQTNQFHSAWDGFEASPGLLGFLTENYANSGWRMLSHAQATLSSFRNNAILIGGGELVVGAVSAAIGAKVAAFTAGLGAKLAARGVAKPFAMGLEHGLDAFAEARGATTWKSLADPVNWKSGVIDKLADPNTMVHFNLDGVDVWGGVSRAAAGRGGATDWELLQIRSNPQWWESLRFWLDGNPAANPFVK